VNIHSLYCICRRETLSLLITEQEDFLIPVTQENQRTVCLEGLSLGRNYRCTQEQECRLHRLEFFWTKRRVSRNMNRKRQSNLKGSTSVYERSGLSAPELHCRLLIFTFLSSLFCLFLLPGYPGCGNVHDMVGSTCFQGLLSGFDNNHYSLTTSDKLLCDTSGTGVSAYWRFFAR